MHIPYHFQIMLFSASFSSAFSPKLLPLLDFLPFPSSSQVFVLEIQGGIQFFVVSPWVADTEHGEVV